MNSKNLNLLWKKGQVLTDLTEIWHHAISYYTELSATKTACPQDVQHLHKGLPKLI